MIFVSNIIAINYKYIYIYIFIYILILIKIIIVKKFLLKLFDCK